MILRMIQLQQLRRQRELLDDRSQHMSNSASKANSLRRRTAEQLAHQPEDSIAPMPLQSKPRQISLRDSNKGSHKDPNLKTVSGPSHPQQQALVSAAQPLGACSPAEAILPEEMIRLDPSREQKPVREPPLTSPPEAASPPATVGLGRLGLVFTPSSGESPVPGMSCFDSPLYDDDCGRDSDDEMAGDFTRWDGSPAQRRAQRISLGGWMKGDAAGASSGSQQGRGKGSSLLEKFNTAQGNGKPIDSQQQAAEHKIVPEQHLACGIDFHSDMAEAVCSVVEADVSSVNVGDEGQGIRGRQGLLAAVRSTELAREVQTASNEPRKAEEEGDRENLMWKQALATVSL